jgi:hypothetical protein
LRETKEEYLAVYALGLRLLGSREHSEIELFNKLKKKLPWRYHKKLFQNWLVAAIVLTKDFRKRVVDPGFVVGSAPVTLPGSFALRELIGRSSRRR